jgi:hypothetical protein
MKTKFCRVCESSLPLEDFPSGGNSSYSKGTCFVCKKKKKKDYYEANKEIILTKFAEYQRTSQKVKDYQAAYFQANKEKNYSATKRWRARNPEKQRAILKADYKSRSYMWTFYVNNRRARKLQATPKWANEFFISEIYNLAKLRTGMTGIECHVDHIVPLKNNLVCGLHWEGNLQIISAKENMVKGNRTWINMPGEFV